jgi:hypothetical protein
VKLVINVGIWNIVAHIAFKFYPGASETFSTASTLYRVSCAADAAEVNPPRTAGVSFTRSLGRREISATR